MGNLSFLAKEESATVAAIYEWHKKRGDAEPARGYLGASIIGHECDRFLWYTFRGCVKRDFTGRMYRLFETGNLEEARFVAELRGIGCEVVEKEDDKQIEVSAVAGHFSGHLDGMALGVPEAPKSWHVCEFKTHNNSSFIKLQAAGVKAAKPTHYAQMMVYMGLTKVDRALYLARNKDTDELYGERVRYSAQEFNAIMARAERIIKASGVPDRMANRSDDFRCKFCEAKALCWHSGTVAVPLPETTCRTCCHATPEMDGNGRWSCNQGLRMDHPCQAHLLLPGLVNFASPVDAGDDWIMFENNDGLDDARWRHGCGSEDWTTDQLMSTPRDKIRAKVSENPLSAAIDDNAPLLQRYPREDSELMWSGTAAGMEKAVRDHVKDAAYGEQKLEDTPDAEVWDFSNKFLVVIHKGRDLVEIFKGKE